jgi:hypothetical protein
MAATNGKIQVAEAFKHLNPIHKLSDSIRGGDFHSIRMKGKVWKLTSGGETYSFVRADDGSPLPALDVVIVGIHPGPGNSRAFYPGAYQDDSNNAPTCSSLAGVFPDPHVPIPQNKTCNGCKRDQWGPNRTGKECKEHKRVAVVLLPYMKTRPSLPKALTSPPVPIFFKVPPASLKVWKAHTDSLQARGAHYAAVITRVTFNPDEQFELKFEYLKALKDSDAELILPLLDSPSVQNILGSNQDFKQIGSVPPIDTPQETGFAAAFGRQAETKTISDAPAKRGPGRPKKQVIEEQEPEEAQASEGAGAQEVSTEDESEASAFTEVQNDDELDTVMTQVLGSRANKTMS